LVDRLPIADVTSLGAAWLAGWKAGIWPDTEGFATRRITARQFQPRMDAEVRGKKLDGWRDAVRRILPDGGST
jgi:glycerol kinase